MATDHTTATSSRATYPQRRNLPVGMGIASEASLCRTCASISTAPMQSRPALDAPSGVRTLGDSRDGGEAVVKTKRDARPRGRQRPASGSYLARLRARRAVVSEGSGEAPPPNDEPATEPAISEERYQTIRVIVVGWTFVASVVFVLGVLLSDGLGVWEHPVVAAVLFLSWPVIAVGGSVLTYRHVRPP